MFGKKYYLDPDTLQYKPIRRPLKTRILRFLLVFTASVLLAFVYLTLLGYFTDSPKYRALKDELTHTETRYEVLQHRLDHMDAILEDLQLNDDKIYRPVVSSDPIPPSLRIAGTGGVEHYKHLESFEKGDLMIRALSRVERLNKRAYVQSRSFEELIQLEKERKSMLQHMPLISPISYKDLLWLGDGLKYRKKHPVLGVGKYHNGLDMVANLGKPVYAAGKGVVTIAGWTPYGFGNEVKIDHGYGFETIYGHLSEVSVEKGDTVVRGQLLGKVGNTGISDGYHLHYEIHKNGRIVNPLYYFHDNLTQEEFEEMLQVMAELDSLYMPN
jgi:murein DD-endopeptidase MepM/ murein hydrolase activator NlpD